MASRLDLCGDYGRRKEKTQRISIFSVLLATRPCPAPPAPAETHTRTHMHPYTVLTPKSEGSSLSFLCPCLVHVSGNWAAFDPGSGRLRGKEKAAMKWHQIACVLSSDFLVWSICYTSFQSSQLAAACVQSIVFSYIQWKSQGGVCLPKLNQNTMNYFLTSHFMDPVWCLLMVTNIQCFHCTCNQCLKQALF